MDIQFRPAKFTDADAALPLIYSAAPEVLTYLYEMSGVQVMDFLRYAFLDGKGIYGWRNHQVAVANHNVVGIAAFFSGQEYRSLTQALMMQMLRFYPKRALPQLSLHSFHITQIIPPPPLFCHFLMNFGVVPEQRSHGIGSAFIHYHRQLATQLGRDSMALDVAANNPRAQALYERLGFEVLIERQFKGTKQAVPDSRRMILSL